MGEEAGPLNKTALTLPQRLPVFHSVSQAVAVALRVHTQQHGGRHMGGSHVIHVTLGL